MKRSRPVTISFLTNITEEDMAKVIASDRRVYIVDPLFIPDPKIKEELLKALAPFKHE